MLIRSRLALTFLVVGLSLTNCRSTVPTVTAPAAPIPAVGIPGQPEIARNEPAPPTLPAPPTPEEDLDPDFQVVADQFADIRVLRYQVPGFYELSLRQRKLLYYLYEAARSGRDIIWDQNYKQNLRVRRTLEAILTHYSGVRGADDWHRFEEYAKRVFFANGIHHHYSSNKIQPGFQPAYLKALIADSPGAKWPLLENESSEQFIATITSVICDPKVAPKRVNRTAGQDLLKTSAMNFYEGVTQAEAEAFYVTQLAKKDPHPISYGLNSKLVKTADGKIEERVWREGGMYDAAIRQIIFWLEHAVTEAENPTQKAAFEKLIAFYRTGDLRIWDEYSILWAKDTESRTDAVSGFIEVYDDPLGYRASFESVVSFKDQAATRTIKAIGDEAQWFEAHSPIDSVYKKPRVTGITAKVITVVSESGRTAPATPIGINLPNSEWIREEHGSKSVSLGNIVYANNEAGKAGGVLEAFAADTAEVRRAKKYASLAANLHTDMHEVIGHASGRLAPGVGTPKETLKSYASAIEEARADLVGLYYILDPKLVQLGVMPSLEVARAQYDAYLRNGLLVQLARIAPTETQLEEAHMRNRQLVASWAYQHGRGAGAGGRDVIERIERDGNTYFRVTDYPKLRELFGQLLREMQRLTSVGDYDAAKNLIETYGVKVDRLLHQQVLQRYGKLNVPPYQGFIQPRLVPVFKGAAIVDVRIEYPTNFLEQMLQYGRDYSLLPNVN